MKKLTLATAGTVVVAGAIAAGSYWSSGQCDKRYGDLKQYVVDTAIAGKVPTVNLSCTTVKEVQDAYLEAAKEHGITKKEMLRSNDHNVYNHIRRGARAKGKDVKPIQRK